MLRWQVGSGDGVVPLLPMAKEWWKEQWEGGRWE